MAVTSIILTDALVGTIVSPGPDQFVTRLEKTRSQWPPYQVENWFSFPLPYGTWRAGRFALRDRGGAGARLINVSSQVGCLTGANALMTNGQSFQFRGDLVLECLPAGEEWQIDFSDVPVLVQQAA